MGEQEIGAVILPRDPCKKVGQRRALINGAPWQIWVYGLWQQERGKDDRPESCAKEGELFVDLARNIYAQSITLLWSRSRKLNWPPSEREKHPLEE